MLHVTKEVEACMGWLQGSGWWVAVAGRWGKIQYSPSGINKFPIFHPMTHLAPTVCITCETTRVEDPK